MAVVAVRFQAGAIVAAGFIAGTVFAFYEMIAASLLQRPAAALMPLRMIAAILLGPAALDPSYSITAAALVGVLLHFALSIDFALMFAATVSRQSSDALLAWQGIVFGAVLWAFNFYVIAPLAGWVWFPRSHAAVQLIAHTLFYGWPLGFSMARFRLAPAA